MCSNDKLCHEDITHEDITNDMLEKIDAVIQTHKKTPGAVITVLRECQDIVNYLPIPLIDYIAGRMNLPASEVFGVASFYSLFSLKPKGRHTVKVCTGTACYVKGIREVLSRIEGEFDLCEGETDKDRRFSLQGVRCLGACGLAPVMVVGDDTHGDVKPEKVVQILDTYK